MEFLARRHFWVVDLVGIAICGILTGHAAAMLILAALPRYEAAAPARRGGMPPPARASAADKSIDAIVARNMFCSACGDDVPAPERSRLPFTLLAIMFAPPPSDPRWSVAIIRDDEAATAGPYAVGAVLGAATIGAIEQVRVVLDVGRGRREYLELLHRPPRAPADGRRAPLDAPADGVTKTGAHSYEIRRAVVEQLLAGGTTPRWPRVVPQARDGEPLGFRLFGIGREGPFAAIGLSDGDLLLEVNGRSIATPDAAMAAFAALRTASHVSLAILREGRRVRIDYVVR